MSHNHDHTSHNQHGHAHGSNERALSLSAIILFVFLVVEVIGGYIADSLILIADAGHMLIDFVAILTALFAVKITKKAPNENFSYGYHRGQVIAAFFNSLTLFATTIWIIIEGVQRLFKPHEISANIVIVFAVIGVAVNLFTMYLLQSGSKDDINIKSAFIHVVGDLFGYISAIIAGIVIKMTGWSQVDPILSIIFAIIIIKSAYSILKSSAHILMEGSPLELDKDQIIAKLKTSLPGVLEVHHMHIWSLTSNNHVLTAHVRTSPSQDHAQLIKQIRKILEHSFNIKHSTIEIEEDHCSDDEDHVHLCAD